MKILIAVFAAVFVTGCSAQDRPELVIPANRVAALVAAEAKNHNVPVAFALAVAKTESNFNPQARSHAGAMGVMQVMPRTWRGMGCTGDPYQAAPNVTCGLRILRMGLAKGDLRYAAASYHGGPGGAYTRASQRYATLVLQRAGIPQRITIASKD